MKNTAQQVRSFLWKDKKVSEWERIKSTSARTSTWKHYHHTNIKYSRFLCFTASFTIFPSHVSVNITHDTNTHVSFLALSLSLSPNIKLSTTAYVLASLSPDDMIAIGELCSKPKTILFRFSQKYGKNSCVLKFFAFHFVCWVALTSVAVFFTLWTCASLVVY